MPELTLSVTQLNEYAGELLSRDPILRGLRVQGEISGFKRHTSGHLYFSLKDESALVRCVMFRQSAQELRFQPRDSMLVAVEGYATLYKRDGQFQLYVNNMYPQGEGDLYRRFLLLKIQLEAKGYFDPAHKKPIPTLPNCVGIITSGTGAVLQDIRSVISRRFPRMNIVVAPVLVQGVNAAEEIASAIRLMNKLNKASVLIVGRGGGSIEDLWAFNELVVAEAIYNSSIPVVSAVGHETDYTIADFVADLRAPTPSTAAELCVPEYDALVQSLDDLVSRQLPHAVEQAFAWKRSRLQTVLQARGFAAVEHQIVLQKQHIAYSVQLLENTVSNKMLQKKDALDKHRERLRLLSPHNMLNRGYAFVTDETGMPLGPIKEIAPKSKLSIRISDGWIAARVTETYEEETAK